MKKLILQTIILFLIFSVSILPLSGCSVKENEFFEKIEMAAYAFGPLLIENVYEVPLKEYVGEEIWFPYFVKGYGYGVVSEFSWFAFVDGIPQRTRLVSYYGEIISDEAYMHHFALAYEELKKFYVVFEPRSGTFNQYVGFIGATIFESDMTNLEYGFFHQLSATLPSEIRIRSFMLSNFDVFHAVELEEMSQDILEELKNFFDSEYNIEELLRTNPIFNLFPVGGKVSLEYIDSVLTFNETIRLNLFLTGGEEVTSRITFFINQEPVQVNESDFIEINMEIGKMTIIPVEIVAENIDDYDILYAIMMTTGADYHIQEIFKTPALILIRE